ncbi:MAG: DUF1848 family protein [Deltaproteobacteria bacterium]|nr:DUF1848 family protein [Deltaproteobacteria bacterium]
MTTDQGRRQEAIAPLIISASRSTDIPAFYGRWFFNRLKRGYLKWINPFNQRPQYVSFEKTRAVVFWSKNPKPIFSFLPELDDRGIGWYFLYTLNDYEAEHLELRVPPLKERIETFLALSEMAGRHRVTWRFDPLVLTDRIGPPELMEKIARIGDQDSHPYGKAGDQFHGCAEVSQGAQEPGPGRGEVAGVQNPGHP